MSRNCAVCGGETSVLRNEHNRVVDYRLCSGECRKKWFEWNKACKAQAIAHSTVYPKEVKGKPVVYDVGDFYDSGDN